MPFPFIDIEPFISEDHVEQSEVFKEFEWDFNNNSFVIRNGKINVVEGAEALKIWIYKAISTVRGRFDAYTWDYGSDLENLISSGLSRDVIVSETKRMIKEALLINEYITDCSDFDISFAGDKMNVNFTANTVYGDIEIRR